MDATIWILNLATLGVIAHSDIGRRRIGWFRLARPLLTIAAIVPFFLRNAATSGAGLALEVAGAGLGLLLGLAAAALMRVETDRDTGQPYSRAGVAYLALWTGVVAARILFAYGAQHWFSHQLGRFLFTNHISVAALTNSLIFMAITMVLARTGTLWARAGSEFSVTRHPSPATAHASRLWAVDDHSEPVYRVNGGNRRAGRRR